MSRPWPHSLETVAQAVAEQVKADGFLSCTRVAGALRVAPLSIKRRLVAVRPLLPEDVAAVLDSGAKAPTARHVNDADVAQAVQELVEAGQAPTSRRVAARLGCSRPAVLRRLPYLELPAHLADAVQAVRCRGGAGPCPEGIRPQKWRGGARARLGKHEVIHAVQEVVAEGPFSLAALARRLGCCWSTAERYMRSIKRRLPPDLAFAVRNYGPTSAPPGSEAKIEVLAERLALGLPLWHKDDAGFDQVEPSDTLVPEGEEEEADGEGRNHLGRTYAARHKHRYRLAKK